MATVPASILAYWSMAFDRAESRHGVMMLERIDGTRHLALSPAVAESVGGTGLTAGDLLERLEEAGVRLHDPDCLFYLPADASSPTQAGRSIAARRLREADRAAFDAFQAAASEQDKEDAWVEFDHWVVFGSFDGDRLVSAASLVPWPDGPVADLGVLTLADARGRGHARAVVEAITRFARSEGREPQYRCQVGNHASIALARACGLVLFGRWIVSMDDPDGAD